MSGSSIINNSPRSIVENVTLEEMRIPAFDGIRGIAIILVLMFHMRPSPELTVATPALEMLISPLWCGVDLFFVLSGFLITGILVDTKQHPRFFLNFYARRSVRILPLYFGVLIGLFLLLPLLARFHIPSIEKVVAGEYYTRLWDNQAWLWFYVQNFIQARGEHQLPGLGHFWSLAIEEQFYLVWPFVVYFLSKKGLFRVSLLMVFFGFPMRWMMMENGFNAWEIRHLTYARIDTLAAGACIALLVRQCPASKLPSIAIFLMLCSLMGIISVYIKLGTLSRGSFEVAVFGYSLFAAFFSGLLLAVFAEMLPPVLMRVLSSKALTLFGTLSYGIYVFHWPVLHASRAVVEKLSSSLDFRMPLLQYLLGNVLTVALTVTIAQLSWKFYELPWLRLKRYFRYHTS